MAGSYDLYRCVCAHTCMRAQVRLCACSPESFDVSLLANLWIKPLMFKTVSHCFL